MLKIEGHAIISANGMIADGEGKMPPFLNNEADWQKFQSALDNAKISVLGRKGHETHPNPKQRTRLCLTSNVDTFKKDENSIFWNPKGIDWHHICQELALYEGTIAITGGKSVFDYFLKVGFTHFHLSVVENTHIENGTPCFSAGNPFEVLEKAKLILNSRQIIDSKNGVVHYTFKTPTFLSTFSV